MKDLILAKKEIKRFPIKHLDFLKSVVKELSNVKDIKEIRYSDIINLITRNNYSGKIYTKLMIWCNYKIRLGESYVNY
ncbi:MAG: hypothetical protein GF317_01440 [Candidatus Lokiarchaeota archaeon]|nr:hypothetical protein [Candidatus Lokiarchaeota archaeon]MBD3198607.1 hypothetical protein [Candidatus Lokiarchaeota archaeon]